MADQESSATDSTTEANEAPEAKGANGTEVDTPAMVARAEFEKLQAHKDKAVAELARYREKDRERQAAHEEKMRAEGEFKALAEAHEKTIAGLNAQIGDLVPLEAKAAAYDAMVAAETERVEAGLSELSEAHQALLRDIDDPLKRARHFDSLRAQEASAAVPDTPNTTLPASAAASGSSGDVDFAAEMKKGVPLSELKARFPKQWAARLNGASNTPKTSFGFARR